MDDVRVTRLEVIVAAQKVVTQEPTVVEDIPTEVIETENQQ